MPWGDFYWGDGFIWGSDAPPAPEGFANGQVHHDGLTLGPGTVYELDEWDPWGRAEPRVEHRSRSLADGDFPASARLGPGRHEFKVSIVAANQAAAREARHALAAAFATKGTTEVTALIWREDGVTYRVHGQSHGIVSNDGPQGMHSKQGVINATVRFHATDPHILSDTGHAITVASRVNATIDIPAVIPLVWVGGTTTVGEVVNDGSARAHWRAEIPGPASNPTIKNVATGEMIRFHGQLADGDVIHLSSEQRSHRVEGGSMIVIQSPTTWWTYPPGVTEIAYRGGGPNPLLMSSRDVWTP